MLSEMALTADHLIVIGRGQLVADSSTYEFIKHSSQRSVVVRTPHVLEFAGVLEEEGVEFTQEEDEEGRLVYVIQDQTTDFVGNLAYSTQINVLELTERKASLEDAFMAMTGHAVEYQAKEQLR